MDVDQAELAPNFADAELQGKVLASAKSKHFPHGIAWGAAAWIAVVHLGALAAPWTFTWAGLGVMLLMYWITGGVGVCLTFHRLLSHRSFSTYAPVRWFLAWIGGLAARGRPSTGSRTIAFIMRRAITWAIRTHRAKAFCGATCFGVCKE